MILIVVKWTIRPEYADTWLERVADFTAGTRAEPGEPIELWAWYAAYDHVVLAQL